MSVGSVITTTIDCNGQPRVVSTERQQGQTIAAWTAAHKADIADARAACTTVGNTQTTADPCVGGTEPIVATTEDAESEEAFLDRWAGMVEAALNAC